MLTRLRQVFRAFRKPREENASLVPMRLAIYPLPENRGVLFHIVKSPDQEVVFVLDRPGVVRLLDTLLDAAQIAPVADDE